MKAYGKFRELLIENNISYIFEEGKYVIVDWPCNSLSRPNPVRVIAELDSHTVRHDYERTSEVIRMGVDFLNNFPVEP